MSKLVDGVPDFLYKPAALNPALLPAIQKEALTLFQEMHNIVEDKQRMFFYFFDFREDFGDLEQYCPVLVSELKRLRIYGLFERALFVQHDFKNPLPVHRDHDKVIDMGYGKFEFEHFGLNIPIAGYQGSYTVFYEGEVYADPADWIYDDKVIGTPAVATAPLAIPETVQEIQRVATNVPLWLNVWALHSAVSTLPEPRLILSLRFKSMQHLFDNGYFDEHLVAN